MIESLPFEWFILLLRLLFIFLIYFFLFQVVRVVLRELQTYSQQQQSAPVVSEPTGHLIVKESGNSGFRSGTRFELEPVSVIGRHPRATILIDDGYVSSEHAQLSWSDGRWWITDLDSTNGTLVNGREVRVPTGLRYGDMIEIGDLQLQLAP